MSGRRPAPRPKRAGEEFARTHHLDEDGPSISKKPRFDVRNPSALAPDAPEEDAVLELDEIGKGGQQTKRNAVNLDGYDSDSSNEGFDARADAKAKHAKKKGRKEGKSEAEDANDMFADLEEGFKDGDEDEEVNREAKKKRKDVRFLAAEEIEGQVSNSKSGGHVSADFSLNTGIGSGKRRDDEVESSSESGGDEERAALGDDVDEEVGAGGKKVHAPKLEAFHLRVEVEEGRFDDQGNFVRKAADPDAVHDSWLEGVSKKDMKKAKDAADKREEELRQKRLADDQILTSDVLKTLILRLDKGETSLEALARLGKGKEKKPKWQNKIKNRRKQDDEMDLDAEKPAEDPAETKRREAVEVITGAADQLLTRGQPEIYDAEREVLMRQYRRETGEDWVDRPVEEAEEEDIDGVRAPKFWEYRWSDTRDGGESHGPYDGATLVAWNDAGYFGDGVEFKLVGDQGEWSRSVDFV
ncbi:MAG: hypothetical protein M1827_003502 [Pycnora praestabilis]|nr:MAG: hypothetical protein M1827_003502 [Pycnora praestabilis]